MLGPVWLPWSRARVLEFRSESQTRRVSETQRVSSTRSRNSSKLVGEGRHLRWILNALWTGHRLVCPNHQRSVHLSQYSQWYGHVNKSFLRAKSVKICCDTNYTHPGDTPPAPHSWHCQCTSVGRSHCQCSLQDRARMSSQCRSN